MGKMIKHFFEVDLASSKNSRVIAKVGNKRLLIKNKKALKEEKAWKSLLLGLPPLKLRDTYLYLHLITNSIRRMDYVNMVQNFLDCAVKEGLLPDDNIFIVTPYFYPALIADKKGLIVSEEPLDFWQDTDLYLGLFNRAELKGDTLYTTCKNTLNSPYWGLVDVKIKIIK